MTDTFTGETYNALCGDAEGYLAGGAPEQARELLLKAVSLIGTRPRARSLLADTCMSMELWPEAREQLEILITLEEGNTRNNFRLGQVLEELGEYQLAADNYTVVLQEEPAHHGAEVALKRIATRTSETGVNLADIFTTPSNSSVDSGSASVTGAERVSGDEIPHTDGVQVYPDLPSDDVFADSGSTDDNLTIDKLLENMSEKPSSDGWKAEDVSRLLGDMGVADGHADLDSIFASQSEQAGEADKAASGEGNGSDSLADLESIFSGAPAITGSDSEKKSGAKSLEDIFGTSQPSVTEEIVEPEASEETEEVIETPVPEAVLEPVSEEPEVAEETEEVIETPVPEDVLEPVSEEPEVAEETEEVIETPVPEDVLEPEAEEIRDIEEEPLEAAEVAEAVEADVLDTEPTPDPDESEEVLAQAEDTSDGPDGISISAGPDSSVFGSMDTLEAIFSAAASAPFMAGTEETAGSPTEVEPLPEEERAESELPADPGEEPVEPETDVADDVPDTGESGLEVVFGAERDEETSVEPGSDEGADEEVMVTEAPEETEVSIEGSVEVQDTEDASLPPVVEEEEASEPDPLETEEETLKDLPEEQAADYFVEAWSAATKLVSITLFSGSISVRTDMLTAFESTLVCEPGMDGICSVSGEGTLMLNCGPVEPLILEAEEGLAVVSGLLAVIPPFGEDQLEPVAGGLSRLRIHNESRIVFRTAAPVRVVQLEGGSSKLLVKAGSIAAATSGVEVSEESVMDGFLAISGQGRLFLIE